MSFEELLMDSLYHLLKIKLKREAHDVVYCDNIPIQKKWSQSPQFFSEKKYRSRWLVLQTSWLVFTEFRHYDHPALKRWNSHSISRSCGCLQLKNFNQKFD